MEKNTEISELYRGYLGVMAKETGNCNIYSIYIYIYIYTHILLMVDDLERFCWAAGGTSLITGGIGYKDEQASLTRALRGT